MPPPQAFLGGFREKESRRAQSASNYLYLKAAPTLFATQKSIHFYRSGDCEIKRQPPL